MSNLTNHPPYVSMFLSDLTPITSLSENARSVFVKQTADTSHDLVEFRVQLSQVLKLNLALTILCVCRNTLTALRGTYIGRLLPLDSTIDFHRVSLSAAAGAMPVADKQVLAVSSGREHKLCGNMCVDRHNPKDILL